MYHGRDDALATFAKQVDVVDEYDTVLHNDTNQHHTTQHRHDVQVNAREPQGQHDTREGEWDGDEHNDERVGPRFELCGHHDEHDQEDKDSQYGEVLERILLVLVRTAHLDVGVAREVTLVAQLLDVCLAGLNDRTKVRNVGIHYARHCVDTLAILAFDGRQRLALHHLSDVTHTHCTCSRRHPDVLDGLHILANLGGVAHDDVVLLTVLAEVGGSGAVEG